MDKHPPPSTTHRHSPIPCGQNSGSFASTHRTPHSTSRLVSRRKTAGLLPLPHASSRSIAGSSSSPCAPDIRSHRRMPSTRRGTCTCFIRNHIGATFARTCSASRFTMVRARVARRKTGSSPTGTSAHSIATRASSAGVRLLRSGRPWPSVFAARSTTSVSASMTRGSSRSRAYLGAAPLSPWRVLAHSL